MVWYSHLIKNILQFVVIHRVKGFGVVNKAEVDVSLELSCFFDDSVDVGNLISGSSAFSKTVALTNPFRTTLNFLYLFSVLLFKTYLKETPNECERGE